MIGGGSSAEASEESLASAARHVGQNAPRPCQLGSHRSLTLSTHTQLFFSHCHHTSSSFFLVASSRGFALFVDVGNCQLSVSLPQRGVVLSSHSSSSSSSLSSRFDPDPHPFFCLYAFLLFRSSHPSLNRCSSRISQINLFLVFLGSGFS